MRHLPILDREVIIRNGPAEYEPSNHWRKLRTTNPLERVNREIKRQTQVVSIFPNTQSCERLITALLIEISEEWMSVPTYMLMENKNVNKVH